MAKNKPNLAFLEALQQEKKRRGEEKKPGGGFKTPEWFFNQKPREGGPGPTAISLGHMPIKSSRPTYLYVIISVLLVGLVGIIAYATFHGKPTNKTGVIENPKTGVSGSSGSEARTDGNAGQQAPAQGNSGQSPVAPPVVPAPSAPGGTDNSTEADGKRTVDLNYVIIQSYKDAKMANEAADLLRKDGVGVTIERDLPYAPGWYSVVGTRGFIRAHDSVPEYRDYRKKIMAVSEKFAGNRKWKRFEPNPYKWK